MKKLFRTKEAGTITPLPPTSPAASSSSFGTPRPFDEYQARVAYQAESNRPLSFQAPSASSRSAGGSSDENGYAQRYTSSQRRSQQFGASDASQRYSPSKNRFSTQTQNPIAADTAYESYSDPASAHSQSFHPSYDHSRAKDHDMCTSWLPSHANQRQQQPASGMAPIPPPLSLRPAQLSSRHRPNNSIGMGIVASPTSFPNQHAASLNPSNVPPATHPSIDPAWPHRHRSDDSDDQDENPVGRTHTAARAHRSAAYPVYSGAGGDQEAAEVLISQGRYEETALRDPVIKDKGKPKKLFGFAAVAKDKKVKQDRDTNVAPSPVPRGSRDRDDARLMSPPMDSHPLPPYERNREGGWMDRWNKRAHQHQAARLQDKEVEEIVASRIGWLAANAYNEQDWMQILPLIDIVSHSEAASKEAARALRKELKYGTVDTQRRAVRIWALLTLNASDRFRFQVAAKRFLDAVEDTVASSKTPLSVKETMLRVLGVLAFEFRSDTELVAVTKCWNKVKPSDRPKDGEPLENNLFEFRLPQPRAAQPPSRRTSQRHPQPSQGPVPANEASRATYTDMVAAAPLAVDPASQRLPSATHAPPQPVAPMQRPFQQTWLRQTLPPNPDTQPRAPAVASHASADHQTSNLTDVVSNLEAAAASMETRSASFQSVSSAPHEPMTFEEDVRRLHEECQIARSNASVLLDTLLHEGLHSDTADLVNEFYIKVLHSQDLIASQVPWASAQADRAERESREEALLADLLDAHSRTCEAVRVVDDARRRIEEEEEERQVTERSKVEVRLDRSALVQDSTGEQFDLGGRGGGMLSVERETGQASGSRSPSPHSGFAATPPTAVLSPSSGFSANSGASSNGVTPRISRPLPVPRSDHSSDSNSTRSMFHKHPVANSLTASIHSTNSTADSHPRSHSRDSSLNLPNTLAASSGPGGVTGGRSLPLTPNLNIDTSAKNETGEDELQTPIVPSEKALGKRRAVSVRYPTPPPVGPGKDSQPPELPPHPKDLVGGMGALRLGY